MRHATVCTKVNSTVLQDVPSPILTTTCCTCIALVRNVHWFCCAHIYGTTCVFFLLRAATVQQRNISGRFTSYSWGDMWNQHSLHVAMGGHSWLRCPLLGPKSRVFHLQAKNACLSHFVGALCFLAAVCALRTNSGANRSNSTN